MGAVLVVVFWTGLPPIFAGGAAFLALAARETGANGKATAALVIAALTVIAVSVVAFIG